MSSKVFMSPNNGYLVVATPLYMVDDLNLDETGVNYFIGYGRPVAYAIDYGGVQLSFLNAEWIEENMEFMGEL